MEQKPTVGRIVHYQSFGTPGGEFKPNARAAIITEVFTDQCVSLCILNPTGMFFTTSVERSDEPAPGRWNWPPRA
jgi:hypothetical protein